MIRQHKLCFHFSIWKPHSCLEGLREALCVRSLLLLEVTSEVKWVRHALEQVIPSEVEGCSLDSEEEVAFSPPEVCQASVQVVEGCPSRLGLLDHRG